MLSAFVYNPYNPSSHLADKTSLLRIFGPNLEIYLLCNKKAENKTSLYTIPFPLRSSFSAKAFRNFTFKSCETDYSYQQHIIVRINNWEHVDILFYDLKRMILNYTRVIFLHIRHYGWRNVAMQQVPRYKVYVTLQYRGLGNRILTFPCEILIGYRPKRLGNKKATAKLRNRAL